jgi:hypothetical protein
MDVLRHLHNQGSWAYDMFLGLDAAVQTSILKEIAHFGLKLMQGISDVQVELIRIMRLHLISLLL